MPTPREVERQTSSVLPGRGDINSRIYDALIAIYDEEDRRWNDNADYRRDNGIDLNRASGFCGSLIVADIVLLSNRRFDLPDGHGAESVSACIIEARAGDGETIVDLVAWPVTNSADVRTLLGRASMVGLWAALNPGTYYLDYPLQVHRTALDWLRAGCDGAAVVIPELAARTFLEIADMGGRISTQDFAHERELKSHLKAMIDRVSVVSPKPERMAA
jgi:hypothetical protein